MIYEATVTTGVEVFVKAVQSKARRNMITRYYAIIRVTALDLERAIGVGWLTEAEAQKQAEGWVADTFGVVAGRAAHVRAHVNRGERLP